MGGLAHLLSGSSGCVAAQLMSAACAELERSARAGNAGTDEAVSLLRAHHGRAAAALTARVAVTLPGDPTQN